MEMNLQHSIDAHTLKTAPSVWSRRAVWSVLIIFMIVEALLGMRFFLKLLGPYSVGVFQDFTYSVTGYLLVPFTAVFAMPLSERFAFEWVTLLGIATYGLLGIGLIALLRPGNRVSKIEHARALSKKKYGQYEKAIPLIGRE